jgi:Na+/H+ antiporter NhaD/arsenite permease-like protein
MRGWRLALVGVASLCLPQIAGAAERAPLDVHVWSATPFAGLLLAIAVLPIVAGKFWHSNAKKLLVAALFAVPAAAYLLVLEWTTGQEGLHALWEGVVEYVEFILLLGVLYVVAGGLLVHAPAHPTPWNNTKFLAVGAVLANLIGTTGASMVLIRPVLRANQVRRHARHVPLFFIFLVSNIGGLLTPLGDPPLFLGFLRGVDFFWTFALWPQWLLANGLVLALFFLWDTWAYRRETLPPPENPPDPVRLRGVINLFFLAGILATVLLRSPDISVPITQWLRQWWPGIDVQVYRPWGSVLMVTMALGSLLFTPRGVRQANGFAWDALLEVAILFAGIFITMVPALDLLARHGSELNLSGPSAYFWLTGLLSSFLDNAPTYLTFATIAADNKPLHALMTDAPVVLAAISCGAVFMGAMTYIGNGPNFMVKTIAENSGLAMPSFLAYIVYSVVILLPIFAAVSFLFFAG